MLTIISLIPLPLLPIQLAREPIPANAVKNPARPAPIRVSPTGTPIPATPPETNPKRAPAPNRTPIDFKLSPLNASRPSATLTIMSFIVDPSAPNLDAAASIPAIAVRNPAIPTPIATMPMVAPAVFPIPNRAPAAPPAARTAPSFKNPPVGISSKASATPTITRLRAVMSVLIHSVSLPPAAIAPINPAIPNPRPAIPAPAPRPFPATEPNVLPNVPSALGAVLFVAFDTASDVLFDSDFLSFSISSSLRSRVSIKEICFMIRLFSASSLSSISCCTSRSSACISINFERLIILPLLSF